MTQRNVKTKIVNARLPEQLDKEIWDFAKYYCNSNQSGAVRFLCEFALMMMKRLGPETIIELIGKQDVYDKDL